MLLLSCQRISAGLIPCSRLHCTQLTKDKRKICLSAIVNLDIPSSTEKPYKRTYLRPHDLLLVESQAAVVPNGIWSEAVALIGEVAVRWYFLRDKAHQVLYPMADVCGKGRDLSRWLVFIPTRFTWRTSIAL